MNQAPKNINNEGAAVIDLTAFTGKTEKVDQPDLQPIGRKDAFIVRVGKAFAPVGADIHSARRWGVSAIATGILATGVLAPDAYKLFKGNERAAPGQASGQTLEDKVDTVVKDATAEPTSEVTAEVKNMLGLEPRFTEKVRPNDGPDAIGARVNPHIYEGPQRDSDKILATRAIINEQINSPNGTLQPGEAVEVPVEPVSNYPMK